MGRKKKNPNPNESGSGEPLADDLQVVSVEVEAHEPEAQSFRDRLTEKLKDVITNEDGERPYESLSPSGKWSRDHKGQRKRGRPAGDDLQAEFSTLVTSVLVVIVTAWRAPEEVKPNDDELNGVSIRLTRIILRHVDISGRMTADVLDLIGIVAIGASYYQRVAPAIKRLPLREQSTQAAIINEPIENDNDRWVTPIEQADPRMKSWLDRVADENNQEG